MAVTAEGLCRLPLHARPCRGAPEKVEPWRAVPFADPSVSLGQMTALTLEPMRISERDSEFAIGDTVFFSS